MALHYVKDKDFNKKADEELQKAAEPAPQQAEVHFTMARRKENANTWRERDKAAWSYETGIEIWQGETQFIKPQWAEAYFRLGRLYTQDTPLEQLEELDERRFNQTYKQWEQAIRLDPEHVLAHRSMSLLPRGARTRRSEVDRDGHARRQAPPRSGRQLLCQRQGARGPAPGVAPDGPGRNGDELDQGGAQAAVRLIGKGRIDAYTSLGHLLEHSAARHPGGARRGLGEAHRAARRADARGGAEMHAIAKRLESGLRSRLREKKEKKAFMKVMQKRNAEEDAVREKREAEEAAAAKAEREAWDALLYDHLEYKISIVLALLLTTVYIYAGKPDHASVQIGRRLLVRAMVVYAAAGGGGGGDVREVDVVNARCLEELPRLATMGSSCGRRRRRSVRGRRRRGGGRAACGGGADRAAGDGRSDRPRV